MGAIPGDSIGLVVEVAVNMARYDLVDKVRVYAMAGVPEYWVVDIEARTIHQMWLPEGEKYARKNKVALGSMVEPITTAASASPPKASERKRRGRLRSKHHRVSFL